MHGALSPGEEITRVGIGHYADERQSLRNQTADVVGCAEVAKLEVVDDDIATSRAGYENRPDRSLGCCAGYDNLLVGRRAPYRSG